MKRKLIKKTKAWAIETNYVGVAGKYYNHFLSVFNLAPTYPEYAQGNKVVLFETRKIGRKYLKEVRYPWPDAKLVKVEVTIKAIE